MNSYIAVDPTTADTLLLNLVRKPASVTELLQSASAVDSGRLEVVGALKGNSLTPIAKQLAPIVDAGVPMHLARVLLAARDLGCLRDAIKLVALLRPGRTIRFRPPEPAYNDEAGKQQCANADKAHIGLARTGYTTDLGRLLGMYDAVVDVQRTNGHGAVNTFCQQHYVAANTFGDANRTHQGLIRLLEGVGIKASSSEKPADEANLIFALMHGLCDMLVESEGRGRSAGSVRSSWIYSSKTQESFLLAPGSTLRNREDDFILLPLFLLRGTGKSTRTYRGHAVPGREYALITEAVEVGADVLALVEKAGLMKVERSNHSHKAWRKDERVACTERWYVAGEQIFDRPGDAPASDTTAMAFARSLTRCDEDDFFGERRPLDPVVIAARLLAKQSGGKFPSFDDGCVRTALAWKLAGVATWSRVSEMDAAGQLVIGWQDVANVCGMELAALLALRDSIETTCPALVSVNGTDVAIQYRAQSGGEVAVLCLDAGSPALAALTAAHIPAALAGRTVEVFVTGFGETMRYHQDSVTGNITALDELRRQVALKLNKTVAPNLPATVGELVKVVSVAHPDRVETVYLVHGSEPFTELAAAQAAALVLVNQWVEQQARAAASPHELEPDLLASSLAEVGELPVLPDTATLEARTGVVRSHVTVSVQRRVARRTELLGELTTLNRHGKHHGEAFASVQSRQAAALLLLRSGNVGAVLLSDAVLEQASAEIAVVRDALPTVTDQDARALDLTARLEALSKDVKAVKGTDFRTERREALARVTALLSAKKLDEATAALAAADKVFQETATLNARGQTRRLKGGQ